MTQKTIYLAGGCFWGSEKAFQLLDGVVDTCAGYANGTVENPSYEEVCKNQTGHRETVRVKYDDEKISLKTILEAYFICIDPTVYNQQGHDVGTQYQTGVYYEDEQDYPIIAEVFEGKKKQYQPFCVELKPLSCFYPAEEYHQDYLIKNPTGYCHINLEQYAKVKALCSK